MPTPTEGYRTKDGKRVPGTTTITGRFKASDGLIHWAWKLPYEPLMWARALIKSHLENGDTGTGILAAHNAFAEFLAVNPDNWDYKKAREKAADAGTCAHALFDAHVRKHDEDFTKIQKETPAHILELASPAYSAALEWAMQSHLEIVETEVRLVSEKYRFGGTRDAILIKGKRAIGDWKTSNTIYPEMLCQLAAYGILDEEATGNPLDGGYHLLRFSKQEKPTDPVHFVHHHWSHLDEAREAFLMMRRLYDIMANLGRLAK